MTSRELARKSLLRSPFDSVSPNPTGLLHHLDRDELGIVANTEGALEEAPAPYTGG